MFKIGDFSKIAQVPISQLRYYDQTGLFQPEEKDPFTDYRYYSVQQLPRLNRILALRDLGLGLDQIARVLESGVSSDEVRGMLTLKQAQIQETLQEEVQRLRAVEARLKMIEAEDQGEELDVVVKSAPPLRFLSLRETFPLMTDSLDVVGELLQLAKELPSSKVGHFTAILHGSAFDLENVDLELGFAFKGSEDPQRVLPSARILAVHDLPEVDTLLTSVRVGQFEQGCITYGALGRWMEANQFQPVGPAREVFLVPPCGTEDPVAEIQFPVQQAPVSIDRTQLR